MTGQRQQQSNKQQQEGGAGRQQQDAGGAGNNSGALPLPSTSYMEQQFLAQQALGEELQRFWAQMATEVEEHSEVLSDFKNQALPLARIKKIMKSDEDVRMISAEAPVLFARACEFFIQELTLRSWSAAQEFRRRTLQRSDLATAISRTDIFDFLVDIVPREEANEPPTGGDAAAAAAAAAAGQLPGGGGSGSAAVPAALPPPALPMGLYGPPGGQQGQQQQQQFLPPPGQQQYMQPPGQQQPFMQQQGGAGGQGGPGMLPFNLPPFMAPPFTAFQMGGPPQQPHGLQFPPQQ